MKIAIGLILISVTLFTAPVTARTILQNDSIQAGDQIAFFPDMNGGESFLSIFEVPEDHPDYQICRVLVWIGPGGFNVFTIRIGEAGDDGDESSLIWQSDLDAYQIFGSRQQLSSVDLADQRIRAQSRRLLVRFRHVEGQDAPPGIASDADGITPGRNKIDVLRRDGRWFRDFTENLDVDGTPPRPPGDWIMRVEIVRPNEACPGAEAPLPDPDPMPMVPDAGMMTPPDAHLPLVEDAGVEPPEMDSEAPEPVDPDAGPMMRLDQGTTPPVDDRFEVNRINPVFGPADRNTEVVINGRGFPDRGEIFAELGETRLLELDVLSASTITAIVPAGMMSGAHDLRLTLSDGRVAILPTAYTVMGESLAINSVSPSTVSRNQPVDLSIQGQGFTGTTRFTIAGIEVGDVSLESPRAARGTLIPSMPVGTYDVVAREGNTVARLEQALEVTERVSDMGVTPSRPGSDDGCASIGPESPWSGLWGLALIVFGMFIRRQNR